VTETPYNSEDTADEGLDLDIAFGEDEVDEVMDTSWSPPERPRGVESFGTTWAEEHEGESLGQRLHQVLPDPALAYADGDEDYVDDGEVGGERAGRLVDPDEGARTDSEKSLVGHDVGIDGGAASAEEAAVHVIPDSGLDEDEGEGWSVVADPDA
jgi:hypothetical protein